MSNLKILLLVPLAILGYLLYKHLNNKFYIEGLDSTATPATTPPASPATTSPATPPATTPPHLVQFDLTLDPDSMLPKPVPKPVPTPPTATTSKSKIGDLCGKGCATGSWCNAKDDKCYQSCYNTKTTCGAHVKRKNKYFCDYDITPICGTTNPSCKGGDFPCPTPAPVS